MKNIFCFLLMSFFLVNCDEKQELNSITTFKLKELLVKENIQLLDVRSPEEIKQGAIKTALFVNYFDDDFAKKATNKLDKNKPVYLYCRSGNRSGKSAIILKEKGFEIYNIIGGYNQWKKEN